MKLAQRNNQKP